uniref:Endo-beta-1,6-galactanase-like domain-containing protein n=1 Tax=Gracilinema caldarium TaxID=215591 RepID=A0A7C3E765_9SPIR
MKEIDNTVIMLRYIALIALSILVSSCNFTFMPEKPLSAEQVVSVNLQDTRQVIDGFGGSNAWMGLPGNTTIRNEVVQLLFSKTKGIGLSILRNRIPFRELNKDGNDDKFVNKDANGHYICSEHNGVKTYSLNWTNWDLQNTKTLISLIKNLHPEEKPENLMVMSTPWTPPNNAVTQWKLNVPNINDYPEIGGYLDPARYQDYADLLADYVTQFSAQMGHPLSVLSIQNEPTWVPNYESCKWNGDQIRDFLKVLGNRFSLKNVSSMVKIMAPEDENFREDLLIPTFADQEARNVLSIVGVHQYDYKYGSSLKHVGRL